MTGASVGAWDPRGLVHPRARLVVGERVLDRDALVAVESSTEAMTGVWVVPATDPLAVWSGWVAAASGGGAILPDREASAPRPLSIRVEGEVSLVLRTSGSTGTSRLAAFEGRAVAWSAETIARSLSWTPDDRIGLVAPVDHAFGLIGVMLAGLSAGATVVAAQGAFAEDRAARIGAHGCTVIAGVSSVVDGVVRHLDDEARRRVRQIGTAGGPLRLSDAQRWREVCSGAVVVNQYGCTEAGPRLTACFSDDPVFDAGSVGRPLPGVEIAVVDGEVVFASPGQMTGYLDDPGSSAARTCDLPSGARGWRTGDAGRVEGDGVWITGRLDDRVKVRGEWVDLAVVVAAAQREGAEEAFAAEVPQGSGRVWLLYAGPHPLTPTALLPHLPRGVVPRLRRVDALPRLGHGKVDRVRARRWLEER